MPAAHFYLSSPSAIMETGIEEVEISLSVVWEWEQTTAILTLEYQMTKFREKQQQFDAVKVPKRERGKTIRFSSPSILLMDRNLHGEWCGGHSVTKCELEQSHAGKEKHGEKKPNSRYCFKHNSSERPCTLSYLLLHQSLLLTYFLFKVSQSYTFLDLC